VPIEAAGLASSSMGRALLAGALPIVAGPWQPVAPVDCNDAEPVLFQEGVIVTLVLAASVCAQR